MSKIAFCFPGQGSIEAGMGRDIAEAVPAGDGRLPSAAARRPASTSSGSASTAEAEELVDTAVQQPALVATSLAVLAAIRERGIEPDYVVGHSVGEFAALAAAESMSVEEAIALVRERGIAMAEAARAASRLDGRDPRARGRGRRDALPPDPRRVAGELQLPRPDRRLRRERRGRRVHRARAGGGRAPRGEAQGVRRVPLAARRARRRPAAAGDRAREVPGAGRAVHVDRDRAPRVGAAHGAAARRPAHRAGAVHAGCVRADEGRRAHVRRGRSRQRALAGSCGGSTAASRRSRSTISRRSTSCTKRSPRRELRLAEGKTALVTGASRGIGRAIATELARGRRVGRDRLPLRQGRGRGARRRARRPRGAGGRLERRRTPRGSSRRRATSTSSSTTPG